MPPKGMSPAAVEVLVAARVAEALAAYEAARLQNQDQSGGSGGSGGNGGNPRPCKYDDFLSCKPISFYGIGGVVELTRWFEKTESVFTISSCAAEYKVKFAACTFMGSALTWWNGHVQVMGLPAANALTWKELKMMLLAEYYPRSEVRRLEQEFWNLTMEGSKIQAYTTRFTELAVLCPGMVNPECKKVERYIGGLAPHIQSMVISANPANFESAKALAVRLMDEGIRQEAMVQRAGAPGELNHKRKSWIPPTSQKKQKVVTTFAATTHTNTAPQKPYHGNLPKCNQCNYHHVGACREMFCTSCKKKGHTARFCRNPASGSARESKAGAGKAGYGCGDIGHFQKDRPKATGTANGRAFAMGAKETLVDPRCVPGTFLINNTCAVVLFDSSTESRFTYNKNSENSKLMNPKTLKDKYIVAMANGQIESTKEILHKCTLTLNGHVFHVDLMPITIGNFDVIIGMDWLEPHHADVMCYEKAVRLNLPIGATRIVYGDKSGDNLRIISCMKAQSIYTISAVHSWRIV